MRRIGPEILGRLFDEHAAALALYARPWCERAGGHRPGRVRRPGAAGARRPIGPSPGSIASCATARSRRGGGRATPAREQRAAGRESVAAAPWFDATDDRIDASARCPAARRAGRRDPRDHHRPLWGGSDLRGRRPAPGLFADHRPPALPGRARPAAREARIPMDIDIPDREPELTALERRLAAWRPARRRARPRPDALRHRPRRRRGPALAAGGGRLCCSSRWARRLPMQQRAALGRERALLTHERTRRLEPNTNSPPDRASRPSPPADVGPPRPPAPGQLPAPTLRGWPPTASPRPVARRRGPARPPPAGPRSRRRPVATLAAPDPGHPAHPRPL